MRKTAYFGCPNLFCMRINTAISFFILCFLLSCETDKKLKTQYDDDITVQEFVSFFPQVNFPFIISDPLLNKKENDSLRISLVAFRSFISKTVFIKYFGTKGKPKLFPLAKGKDSDGNTFLFIKSIWTGKKGYVFCFNKELRYVNSMVIAETDKDPDYRKYCEVNKSMNLKIVEERKKGDGVDIKENNFFLDNSGQFRTAVILTNKDLSDEVPVNPIDTLPRKNKYSADYVLDKKNIVSVRDGTGSRQYLFFIHFSKQKGECTGELKGKAEIFATNKAVFNDKTGPCRIEFTFTNNNVTIKEVGGCGSYRGITCFFEGTYLKKKVRIKSKVGRKT
ncbi:MAG TPA: hypothetical protein VFN30_02425 [Chitinophagaceae bacterium]|nr:hypothetical protein [Chitinophagaceae bacterium]